MNLTDQLVDVALLGAEWVLWLLLLLSILSVGVMVERALFLYKRQVDASSVEKAVVTAVREDTVAGLRKRWGDSDAMIARVAIAGVEARDRGIESVEEAMNSAKASAREDYERNLVVLGTLGNNAPFIGLFGTVLGIIQAFHELQANPEGGIDVVMGSVSEALVATAVGILVAIPAVVAFNVLNRRVRGASAATDAVAHRVLAELHAHRAGGAEER